MTEQELLTKIATKCKTWESACSYLAWYGSQVPEGTEVWFHEDEWLDERERLQKEGI